jgi:3-oxoacyl-[acyl-carrier-protein] synthase-3
MKIDILSIEKYLPEHRISSVVLDRLAGGVAGRIEKNTGVKFRHHVSGTESVAEMGAHALQKALDKAGLQPEDLDLLIFAGGSFDYPVPHNSVLIKSKITDDTVNFYCFDIDSTCLSFLNALDVAHLYLQSGRYKIIAIVCAEIASKALTPTDEKVFGLFGDAAVATIIGSTKNGGYTPCYVSFKNYPSGALLAYVPVGGAIDRGMHALPADTGYYFRMDGKNLIRLTIKHLDNFVSDLEKNVSIKITSFDHIITHQTSKYGNNYFIDHFKVDPARVVETLSDYGNCIAASIPLGLEKLFNSGAALKNKNILLLGSGAGLSLGAVALKFE